MASIPREAQIAAAVIGGGLVVTSAAAALIARRRKAAKMKQFAEAPRGTVILHQIEKCAYAPSLSPFPIKLETFLRINKIPYESDRVNGFGPKGKTPWMTFNGEHTGDSQLCIERLKRELGVDMNKHLTAAQRATARAFRLMLEDSMYWIVVRWRCTEPGEANDFARKVFPLPGFVMSMVKRGIVKTLYAQGTGRHTSEEVNKIAEENIVALSDFLGDKKFLMGDMVCEEDCCIFGFLTQIVYGQLPGTVLDPLLKGKCRNLRQYCERIKTQFWPDWEDCLDPTLV